MLEQVPTSVTASRVHPGLLGREYSDPSVFEQERERIFFRDWFCVGREQDLADPNAYLTRDIAGESILLTRDRDGALHAFFNVCRHRGSVLVEDPPAGLAKGALVCPYHSWTYALDGRLIGTPNVHDEDGLDRDAFGLRAVHVDAWDGFLFVNLSVEPTPLLDQLAMDPDEPLSYGRYRAGELRVGARIVYEVAANWKIVHDNYNECLHCPGVHPELTKIVPLYRKGMVWDERREDGGVFLGQGLTTFTLSGTSDKLPELPDLSEVDRCTYYGYTAFPNLLVNLLSTGIMSYTLYPRSAGHTTIVSEYLFRPETVDADGFDPSEMVEFLDLVSRQDWTVCERAQRGVASRGFVQGVYPPQDELLHRFAERYRGEMARRLPSPPEA
ncbi:MAG TPA: aromatic ring-hydroxylating dioxygenase subunit alpha [Actinomycetota bacterium]|jgi:Rieske 2Fe-2S family protein|nr:aromatic ring-hydroxylating dioxygenase subunit alpha [Actinomycetota bacterium]